MGVYCFRFDPKRIPRGTAAEAIEENGWRLYGAVAQRRDMGDPFNGSHQRAMLAVRDAYETGTRAADELRAVYDSTR